MKSDLPQRLKDARRDLRLTQDQLAKRWGYTDGNYIYMLEARKKPFPRHLEEQVKQLELEVQQRQEKSNLLLSERGAPYGGKEVQEPGFHIGLNLTLEKLTPQQLSQLLKQINTDNRIEPNWKTFWVLVISDWLEIKLAGNPPGVSSKAKSDAAKIALRVSQDLTDKKQ